jgi:RNA polymerase sigma-70 factor (ECF subfamily)
MSNHGAVCHIADDLRAARVGDLDALGRLFEGFRVYLLIIANHELDDDLRAKCGASDVVQDTLCEAHSGFNHFRGETDEDLRAWLRRALLNNLRDVTRRYVGTRKRNVRDEVPVEASPRDALVDPRLTPGAQLVAGEEAARLERALERLPEDYRWIIDLRFRQQLPFDSIGHIMNRSKDSARMLLFRAVEKLQGELGVVHDAIERP